MLVYLRACPEQTLLVICNKSGETVPFLLPERLTDGSWKRLLTNREDTVPSLDVRRPWLPWEAEIYASLNVS